MAAAAEHTEEHAAQIHYEEDAQLLAPHPIEPQTHYQECNINYATYNSRIKERRYDWVMREIVTFRIIIELFAIPFKIFETLSKNFMLRIVTCLPQFKSIAPAVGT